MTHGDHDVTHRLLSGERWKPSPQAEPWTTKLRGLACG